MNARAQHLLAIDLLRFACALLVVSYHFGVSDWLVAGDHVKAALAGITMPFDAGPVARVEWIGVELFFVISGLVIAQSAVGVDVVSFARRRALRLLPGAWICATITACMLIADGQASAMLAVSWARSIAFVPVGDQIDGSYWTLGVEVAFYTVVALFGRGSRHRIEGIAVVLGTASAVFWCVCILGGPPWIGLRNERVIILALLPHGSLFALGITLAMLAERPTIVRAIMAAVLVGVSLLEIIGHTAERLRTDVPTSWMLAAAAFLAGVLMLLAATRLQPWLARYLDAGIVRTLGLMTYPLYLIHQDAGAVIVSALVGAGLTTATSVAVAVLANFALAWAVATWGEPAVRRNLAAVFSRCRVPRPYSRRSASPPIG